MTQQNERKPEVKSRVAGMLDRSAKEDLPKVDAKGWTWDQLIHYVASGDTPEPQENILQTVEEDYSKMDLFPVHDYEEEETDPQDYVDELVREANSIRKEAIKLVAREDADATTIRWMVDGNERVGGESWVKATTQELKRLPKTLLKVYLHIKRVQGTDAGVCADSHLEIADALDIGERTVDRALPELIEMNCIRKTKVFAQRTKNGWTQSPHLYKVVPCKYWKRPKN